MSAPAQSDPLNDFLLSLPPNDAASTTPLDPCADPVEELVWSMLLWEAPRAKAQRAHKRVLSGVVDLNELRVCLPHEVVAMLGERYPNVCERTDRLLGALHEIYLREHAVTLEPLREAPKREAKKYLESIAPAPQFATARVLLLSLGAHAIPLDARMHAGLVAAGAIDPDLDEARTASLLERTVRAVEAPGVHGAMLHWAESGADAPSKSPRRSGGKKKATGSR